MNSKSDKKKSVEYSSWSCAHIVNWIISIDPSFKQKYEQSLLQSITANGITGSHLKNLDREDLTLLGIINNNDKRKIYKALQRLIAGAKKSKKPQWNSWGYADLANWIISIDPSFKQKYEETLLSALTKNEITGLRLKDLDREDLTQCGIINREDKKTIYKAIQRLISSSTAKKSKRNGIRNNPRLNPKLAAKLDLKKDESRELMTDYEYLMYCLSSPKAALRPQEILEYIAILIKIYIGAVRKINIHQNTFIINPKSDVKYTLKSIQNKCKDTVDTMQWSIQLQIPVNINGLADLTRIALIVPIIYYNSVNINMKDTIAVLQERKTRVSAQDFKKAIIFPYILDHKQYEWYLLNDLYITAIQKNYQWRQQGFENINVRQYDVNYLRKAFLAETYGKIRNIIKCIIVCDPITNHKICLFTTTSGLFYTDHRLYHDINDMNISMPILYESENDHGREIIFVDFWTQGSNDIYIWNNDDHTLYNINYNVNGILDKNGLDKLIKEMEETVHNDNKNDKKNKNKKEMSPDAMNAKLRANGLFTVHRMFKINSKKSIFDTSGKANPNHCEIKAVYYQNDIEGYIAAVYWIELSKPHKQWYEDNLQQKWRFGAISRDEISAQNRLRAKEKEKEFYQNAPTGLIEEPLRIAFVDERDINDKKFVIILRKYVVIIPLLKKADNTKPFGYILNVKDIAPKVLLMEDEIKFQSINEWYYNYSNTMLYVFEKMQARGVYPFRMNEIALNTFKFP